MCVFIVLVINVVINIFYFKKGWADLLTYIIIFFLCVDVNVNEIVFNQEVLEEANFT